MQGSQQILTNGAGILLLGICVLAIGFMIWVLLAWLREGKRNNTDMKFRFVLKADLSQERVCVSETPSSWEQIAEPTADRIPGESHHRQFIVGA